jgi:hypothetical protein
MAYKYGRYMPAKLRSGLDNLATRLVSSRSLVPDWESRHKTSHTPLAIAADWHTIYRHPQATYIIHWTGASTMISRNLLRCCFTIVEGAAEMKKDEGEESFFIAFCTALLQLLLLVRAHFSYASRLPLWRGVPPTAKPWDAMPTHLFL